jgi:hypothetical protein
MKITISHFGVSYPLEIPRAARIVEVKLQIEKIFDIPPEKMDLAYNGVLWLRKDEMTLLDYQIPSGAKLSLYKKFLVWIRIDSDRRYSLMVNDETSVGDLKELLHAKSGLHVRLNKLQYPKDHDLSDGCFLWSYGIRDESELYLDQL